MREKKSPADVGETQPLLVGEAALILDHCISYRTNVREEPEGHTTQIAMTITTCLFAREFAGEKNRAVNGEHCQN